MQEVHAIECPYCGESIQVLTDASGGDADYIEDCSVCCRPIAIGLRIGHDGQVGLRAVRSD